MYVRFLMMRFQNWILTSMINLLNRTTIYIHLNIPLREITRNHLLRAQSVSLNPEYWQYCSKYFHLHWINWSSMVLVKTESSRTRGRNHYITTMQRVCLHGLFLQHLIWSFSSWDLPLSNWFLLKQMITSLDSYYYSINSIGKAPNFFEAFYPLCTKQLPIKVQVCF